MIEENYEYKVGSSNIKCKVESDTTSQNIQKPDLLNNVIKSMILMYQHSGSKEMRSIILLAGKESTIVSDLFEKVLISTKLSNKESLFLLEIIGQFPEWLEDTTVTRVADYRFAAQDKYLDRLVIEYFRLILAIYDRLSHEQLVEIYYKFIYLFENGICENMAIYRLFRNFLDNGMVSLFLYKRGYMKIRFLKEFIVDFRKMGGVLVRIGYERAETRRLVYSLLSGSSESNWILQRWKVYGYSGLTIAGLFYACDSVYFIKDIGLRQMELSSNLRDTLEKELQEATNICTNTFWCTNKSDSSKYCNDSTSNINECNKNECNKNECNKNECNKNECNKNECNKNECNKNECNKNECNKNCTSNINECNINECNKNCTSNINECNKNECNINECNKNCTSNINECNDNIKISKTSSIDYAIEKKKKYQQAVMYFNEKGELADKYTAVEMYISPMVDLNTLGRFLCNHKHSDALQTFIGAFCFTGMDLLDALRLFLSGFCLVGESQIVERVVGIFIETYLTQNSDVEECIEVAKEYRNLGYSFLALNTMLHNATVDKKPNFEDYLRMVGFNDNFFTKKETLRQYYVSVKDNEIKYPHQWHDSYDKYLMAINLQKKYFIEIINETNREHNNNASNRITTFINDSDNNNCNTSASKSLNNSIFHLPSNPTKFCRDCILTAYKTLFKKAYSRYFSMDPTEFYELCSLIGDQDIYEAYVRHQSVAYKNNVVRIVNSWRHLLENYLIRNETLLSTLVFCANKIENIRESIFRDLSLLSVRQNQNSGTTGYSRDAIIGSVNPLYAQPVQTLLDIHFTTSQICCANTILLSSAKNDLIDKIVIQLIIKHIDWITNLEEYRGLIRNNVITACPDTITCLSPHNKLDYLSSKKKLSTTDFKIYTSCRIPCDAGFELFCQFQREYDIFDDYITISRSEDIKDEIDITNGNDDYITNNLIKLTDNEDSNGSKNKTCISNGQYSPFLINEFYEEQLLIPKNVLKLFLTSSNVLNPILASSVHRPSAPHDKIAYLLIKTDTFKTPLFDHFTTVIESLSNCLPLFLDIVHYIYPLLFCISPETSSIFLHIFIARLKKYKKNCVACCQENKPPLSTINRIVERLVADNFIKKDAFPLFSTTNVYEI